MLRELIAKILKQVQDNNKIFFMLEILLRESMTRFLKHTD